MKDKKGLSEVVTAILIVLLAVAAVIIVWAVIRPMIQGSSSQVQTSCVTLDVEIVAVDETGNDITLRRNVGDGELHSLVFTFETATGTTVGYTDEITGFDQLETYVVQDVNANLNNADGTTFTLPAWASVNRLGVAVRVETETSDLQLCPVSDTMDEELFTP